MSGQDPLSEQLEEIRRRLDPERAREFFDAWINEHFARPSADGTVLLDPADGRPLAEFVPIDRPAGGGVERPVPGVPSSREGREWG